MIKIRPFLCAGVLVQLLAPEIDAAGFPVALASAPPISRGSATPSADDAKLIADVANFKAESATLGAREAAQQWLGLVDRALASSSGGYYDRDLQMPSFEKLVEVLPPPATWSFLRSEVDARNPSDAAGKGQALMLKWFVYRLLGDVPALAGLYDQLTAQMGTLPPDRQQMAGNLLESLERELFKICDDGEVLTKIVERRIEQYQRSSSTAGDFRDSSQQLQVPDLVTLVGAEKAEIILNKALGGLPAMVEVDDGVETGKLAAKIALANVAKLKVAQWNLAESYDGGALYKALLEKFGPAVEDSNFQSARAYELLRLLMAGKTEEALKVARQITGENDFSLPSEAMDIAERMGRGQIVNEFFKGLLTENPNLPYWSSYTTVAVRTGHAAEMLALMEESLKNEKLNAKSRQQLEGDYIDALLAANKVDDGVKLLMKIVNGPAPKDEDSSDDRSANALKVAQIGILLKRPEWVESGLSSAGKLLEAKWKAAKLSSELQYEARDYSRMLMDLGRKAEAEAVLLKSVEVLQKAIKSAGPNDYVDSEMTRDLLCSLVGVYTASGKSAEVVELLANAPGWAASDLSAILTENCYLGDRQTATLGECAAKALYTAGKQNEALRIVRAALDSTQDDDGLFELLIAWEGSQAMPLLDQLSARDPFEERPLIWKAKLLLDEGKLPEAEAVARAAIKIDPSDGKEGPGDRMRVYAVLAEILKQKGDEKQAETYLGVMRAIRLSEQADVFDGAGLESQAIAMYKESLTYFSDAYCIQSRLALSLSDAGDWKGAEEHYRRAYELMPDSFGRVESHCFGCESAFAGEKQQGIAETVFNGIAADRPDNPQVHYLLGYLRAEQERYAEALPEYEKAVALDPDYLNAWKKIDGLEGSFHLPAAIRNATVLNLIRLDPRQEHSSPGIDAATNLPEVWQALEKANVAYPAAPKDLLPLPASAAAMAADSQRERSRYRSHESTRDLAPGACFARQSFTTTPAQYFQYTAILFR